MNRIMAPLAAPTKAPGLQGKDDAGPGSVPFGGSNGLVCLFCLRREEYCHNGGMAFAQHRGVGLRGSKMTMMVTSGGPLKTAGLQGKSRRVRGSVAFGGSNGLVCLSRREKYCPNGGMAFADVISAANREELRAGEQKSHLLTPCLSPRSPSFAGERSWGQRFASLWGQQWPRLPLHT
jgi:hypothetical protein